MIQKIIHIILAVLIFISSTGFVINKHYCRDELKSIALFAKAKPCHQAKMKHCPFHNPPQDEEGQSDSKKGCCDDKTELVKIDDEQITTSFDFQLKLNPVLVSTLFVVLRLELPSLFPQNLHYLNYKPPLIVCDLSVRLQTFLC